MWFIGFNLIILAIILGHKLFAGRLSSGVMYRSWLIVPVFLLLVNFIHFDVPVFEKTKQEANVKEEVSQVETDAGAYAEKDRQPIAQNIEKTVVSGLSGGAQKTPVKTVIFRVIAWIYLIGAVGCALLLTILNIGFYLRLRNNRVFYQKDGESGLSIWLSNKSYSPFLLGRSIYIHPDMTIDPKKMRYAICHETCHHKHLDMVWNFVKYLMLSLFWFDPLVWYASHVFEDDCELYCDESVIKMIGEDYKKEYGLMLLDVFTKGRNEKKGLYLTTPFGGRKNSLIERRIIKIAKGSTTRMISLILFCIMITATMGFAMVNPVEKEVKDIVKETVIEPIKAAQQDDDTEEKEPGDRPSDKVLQDTDFNSIDTVSLNVPERYREHDSDLVTIDLEDKQFVYDEDGNVVWQEYQGKVESSDEDFKQYDDELYAELTEEGLPFESGFSFFDRDAFPFLSFEEDKVKYSLGNYGYYYQFHGDNRIKAWFFIEVNDMIMQNIEPKFSDKTNTGNGFTAPDPTDPNYVYEYIRDKGLLIRYTPEPKTITVDEPEYDNTIICDHLDLPKDYITMGADDATDVYTEERDGETWTIYEFTIDDD